MSTLPFWVNLGGEPAARPRRAAAAPSSPPPLRLLVVSTTELVRRGVVALLQPHTDQISVTTTTVPRAVIVSPDIVLFDQADHTESAWAECRSMGASAVALLTWEADRYPTAGWGFLEADGAVGAHLDSVELLAQLRAVLARARGNSR